nr:oxygen-regulated protein 1-like [Paramormyrops kingsleyae]
MTSPQIPIQQDQSSGSTLTMGSRHPYLTEPIASKRVSFYKSGDPQFSALRMVINSRTFKTFDALLDSLSKKVPLPFGVRNITTPHGVHPVRTLEELEDGKAYICSDQKKVKPFDLEMAGRRLPPWYHARPISARSRTLQLTNLKDGRFLVRDGPALLRTPKRLTVFRNGDPGRKHTVILARKTTPTFDSLLDHVSEVLRFHVVKLYTSDGRRVNSLPALIMSPGILVAAGRENFKPGSYSIQKPAPRTRRRLVNHQMQRHRVQVLTRKNKLLSRSSKARNFSRASERYIANQISSSITGSLFELPSNTVGSVDTGTNNQSQSMEADTCSYMEGDPILPPDDDIEKSFRVNSDGSMTVEMKVRLTVKEEEIVNWTTTLSRSSVANQLKAGCIPQNKPICSTPDSNVISTKGPNDKVGKNEYMSNKEIDLSSYGNGRFCDEVVNDISGVTGNLDRLSLRRQPTPGPRGIQKRLASVESIRDVSAIDNQDNMVGTCTYLEETGSYEVTEEYHMVRQCSNWPISKPRKDGSMEVNNNSPGTNEKSSSVAEVLQIHNSGEEITETTLKLYEQQSYCDSFCENMPWSQRRLFVLKHRTAMQKKTFTLKNVHAVSTRKQNIQRKSIDPAKRKLFAEKNMITVWKASRVL